MMNLKASTLLKVAAVFLILVALNMLPYAVSIAQNDNNGWQFGPSIAIEKYFTFDGGITWLDASEATGPFVAKGTPVEFKFAIRNDGSETLTDIKLTDSVFGDLNTVVQPVLPGSLGPGALFEGTLSGKTVTTGQHLNRATVTAVYAVYQPEVTAIAEAYYFGYDSQPGPAISIKKSVSVDGGSTWQDADTAPGQSVSAGSAVRFKFLITNGGSIPLTGLNLTDNVFIPGGLSIPGTLLPGTSYTHFITDITAVTGQHWNEATVSAVSAVYSVYQPDIFRASDMAYYYGTTPVTPSPPDKETPPTEGHLPFGVLTAALALLLGLILLTKNNHLGLMTRKGKH